MHLLTHEYDEVLQQAFEDITAKVDSFTTSKELEEEATNALCDFGFAGENLEHAAIYLCLELHEYMGF